MAVHWRPVGPLPPATYWRRRVAVVAVPVLAVGLLRGCTGGGGPSRPAGRVSVPTASPPATAVRSGSPRASAPPAAGGGQARDCSDGDLSLTAATDAPSYPAGTTAALSVTVRNTGTSPCRRDLGHDAVQLVVVSGSDRIWSSGDCPTGAASDRVSLDPGSQVVLRASWAGRRSSPGCGAGPVAQAGTYRLSVVLGTLRLLGPVFHVS